MTTKKPNKEFKKALTSIICTGGLGASTIALSALYTQQSKELEKLQLELANQPELPSPIECPEKSELAEKIAELEQTQNEKDALTKENTNLKGENENLKTRLQNLGKPDSEKDGQIAQFQKMLGEKQVEISKLKAELETLKKQLTSNPKDSVGKGTEIYNNLKSQLNYYIGRLTQSDGYISALQRKFAEVKKELSIDLEQADATRAQLTTEVERLKQEKEPRLSAKVQELQSQLEYYKQQAEIMDSVITTLEEALENYQNESEAPVKPLLDKIVELQRANNNLNSLLESLITRLNKTEQDLNITLGILSAKDREVSEMEIKLGDQSS